MKHLYPRTLLALMLASCGLVSSAHAQRRGWYNYNDGTIVTSLVNDGTTLWAGTEGGGLIKFDKAAGTKSIFNKANSGLWGNTITCMTKDSKGNLWIGTNGQGLIKFDRQGPDWSHFTRYGDDNSELPDMTVRAVAVDNNDNIWVGTDNGAAMFNTTYSYWAVYNTTNSQLADNRITAVAISPDSKVWVGTKSKGLGKFDGLSWTIYRKQVIGNDSVTTINGNVHGTVWIGTNNGKLAYLDGDTWKLYDPKLVDQDLFFSKDKPIQAITEGTSASEILIGTYGNFTRYDGTATTRIPDKIAGITDGVHAIVVDPDNTIWTGTQQNGIVKISGTATAKYPTTATALLGNTIGNLMIDRDNNVWSGMSVSAFKFHLADSSWTRVGTQGSGFGAVTATAQDSTGIYWMAKDDGLFTFEGGGFPKSKNVPGLGADNYTAVVATGTTVWVGHEKGVASYDGTNWTVYTHATASNLPDASVSALALDKNGNLWVGTRGGGIAKFSGGAWTLYDMATSPSIPSTNINTLLVDREGMLWVGTSDAGLAKFDGTNWTVYNADNTSSLKSDNIVSLAMGADGKLWVGTAGAGILKTDGTTFTSYSAINSGLPDDLVSAVAVDHNGRVWVGTRLSGLAMFDEPLLLGTNGPAATASARMLQANAPNPFNGSTTITVAMEHTGYARLGVFNARGEEIALLVDGTLAAGSHEIAFDAAGLPAGTYFARLVAGGAIESSSMVLVR
jgi:ligand-binding sensor domain-containing protein